MSIAKYIDHTILKPETVRKDVEKLCGEALELGCAAVCVPPPYVAFCHERLSGSSVRVATVIGFPFGYSVAPAKLTETRTAVADGADELDMVLNLVALKNGRWDALEQELEPILDHVHSHGKALKVIIESGILTDEEIRRCCALYGSAGVDFVKTSTGYAENGATTAAVQLMRRSLPSGIRIKASGGIRSYAFALELLEAGADRLGCSATVRIVGEEKESSSGNSR